MEPLLSCSSLKSVIKSMPDTARLLRLLPLQLSLSSLAVWSVKLPEQFYAVLAVSSPSSPPPLSPPTLLTCPITGDRASL